MNNGIISKAGLFGLTGWLAVAGLSVVILRHGSPSASPVSAPEQTEIEVAQGVFDRQAGERPHLKNGPVSEQDWTEAKEFLKSHSPFRFHVIENIPSGETREGLKHFLVNRWRSIVELKSKSPDLYSTRVREVELEDDVFGICQRLKHGKANQTELQAELNKKIADLFSLGLTERKQRISLVEQSLVEQKKTLESDEQNKVKLTQQQYDYVLAHGVEGARLDVTTVHHLGQKSKTGSSTSPSPGESESSDKSTP